MINLAILSAPPLADFNGRKTDAESSVSRNWISISSFVGAGRREDPDIVVTLLAKRRGRWHRRVV